MPPSLRRACLSFSGWKVIWGSPRDLGGSPSVGGQRWIPGGWKVNCGSRAVVEPPGVPEFCEGSSTGPGGSQGIWGSAHRSTPWCAFWSGMDALDEYGSSDNESAGAPASNAVPAALTSPPGSPSTRNAAQALVQLERGFCCARCCAVLPRAAACSRRAPHSQPRALRAAAARPDCPVRFAAARVPRRVPCAAPTARLLDGAARSRLTWLRVDEQQGTRTRCCLSMRRQ